MACALKIQRKSFTAADTHLTASAVALKLKIATQRVRSKKILEPSFYRRYRKF